MEITYTTDMHVIKLELHEGQVCTPMVMSDNFLREIHSEKYAPHLVEAMIEKDATVKRVSVDWNRPWKTDYKP